MSTYLVRDDREVAERVLRDELEGMPVAFWSGSLGVAPEQTAPVVRRALIDLVSATDPDRGTGLEGVGSLRGRPRRIVGDLARLAASLGGRLPGDLGPIRRLLDAPPDRALRPIRVYVAEGVTHLTRWQRRLVARLNRDAGRAGVSPDPDLELMLDRALPGRVCAAAGSALEALQRRLFAPGAESTAIDGTVQWVGVRDFYQEAETAAGMAQEMLVADRTLAPADIGVLLPDDFGYTLALEDAFGLAGLALSGQLTERWRRDLGAEAVFHFLFCRQKPAPAMALAACLSSPLMPWTVEDGTALARRVMDGRYDLPAPPDAGTDAAAMVALIGDGDTDPAAVSAALERFVSLLSGGEGFAMHRKRAREAAERAGEVLAESPEVDWVATRRAATPRHIANGEPARFSLEGVTVLRERQEPWRDVRHLFVLGLHQGRFPRDLSPSPVFPPDDLRAIQRYTGLPLPSAADEFRWRRERFRRQLRAASDSVTFLTSRRQETGRQQSPSESLVFMEALFERSGTGTGLVAELDSAEDRKGIRHLALARESAALPPRNFRCGTLHLGRDLLAIRRRRDGTPWPESPSSLETLLVSPLAWLLRRLGVEPAAWAPETASPLVLGSLAHGVFEELFRPGRALPGREGLSAEAGRRLDEVAMQQAPFIRGPQWRVERQHLAEQAGMAAVAWRDALEGLGARVIASEQWLEGEWEQVAVHGRVDLILALDGDRLLVVDYKWSKADARHERIERGYDTQVSIYRAMARTGGAPRGAANSDTLELAAAMRRATKIGIAYFTMRDCVCLADQGLPRSASVRGWHRISPDADFAATALIRHRLADVRNGKVPMNRSNDREEFSKVGVATYALEASPLIKVFAERAPAGSEAS